ncbi:elongation factor 1-beta 2 [Ricinus communis]|uniref:Elongation factor 1-beta, putative n=1 Tax=Ricinus communis TaxID=3988 RepID=B9SB41_RICCO|nr:elongation factor 1-beta 2 [Ricinus communis]EEF39131.1 elongation factor 1-beta, putative [Ricinus communis]|eukprot:XP_002523210.1 elongation factor 1-beta 2 [Ricinus communis]
MAVTFSDLHTESGLKSLDEFLAGKSYISGDQLTKDDIKVYAAVLEKPGASFPNASKWYESVSSHLATSFPGKAVGVRVGGKVAAAPAEAAAPAKEAAAAGDDDDDLDLFGDETEEDKKAAEEREAAKKSAKKKESGKSSVLMDVKPWDDETDMKKLEEAVRSIEMPGLLWGASKLVPVGYGIKKLQIMMTIVDDLVSVDSLIEEYLTVEPYNEYVQSCDIVAFNKI